MKGVYILGLDRFPIEMGCWPIAASRLSTIDVAAGMLGSLLVDSEINPLQALCNDESNAV